MISLTEHGFNETNIVQYMNIQTLFRFPIVDGRLPLDPMKISCWKKNIRNDYLTFNFQNILIIWKSCINVIIDELDGFYCVRIYL